MSNMDAKQYQTKRDEVLSKFHLVDMLDPTTNAVINSLIIGSCPYEIIETLLTANIEQQKQISDLLTNGVPAIYICVDNPKTVNASFIKKGDNIV